MNDRIARHLDAFKRTVTFVNEYSGDFVAPSAVPALKTSLAGVITNMTSASAGQLGKTGADVKDGLLDALLMDLQLINNLARALDPDNPGLADKFPAASNAANSIISTADAYLAQLEIKATDSPAVQAQKTALQQVFITHEMAATFVADLRSDRDAVDPASVAQETKFSTKVQSTASLGAFDRMGMKFLGQIKAALRAKYARTADKLAAALSATHIERAPKRVTTPSAPAHP